MKNVKDYENEIENKMKDDSLASEKNVLPDKYIPSPIVTSNEEDFNNLKIKKRKKSIFDKF